MFLFTNEYHFRVLEDIYDDAGCCKPIDAVQGAVRAPERLVWDVSSALSTLVQKALKTNQEVSHCWKDPLKFVHVKHASINLFVRCKLIL